MSAEKGKVQEMIDKAMLEERKVFLWGMVDDDSACKMDDVVGWPWLWRMEGATKACEVWTTSAVKNASNLV